MRAFGDAPPAPPRPARPEQGRAAAPHVRESHRLLPPLINLTEVGEPPGNKLRSDSTGGPVSNENGSGLKNNTFFVVAFFKKNFSFPLPPSAALEYLAGEGASSVTSIYRFKAYVFSLSSEKARARNFNTS